MGNPSRIWGTIFVLVFPFATGCYIRPSKAVNPFNPKKLGESFELISGKDGAAIDRLYLHLETSNGLILRLHVHSDAGYEASISLTRLPFVFHRFEIHLEQETKKSATFRVLEAPCKDEDFSFVESNTWIHSDCTPIIQQDHWKGIAISAPKEIHFDRSMRETSKVDPALASVTVKVPKIIVAGTYVFETAVLRSHGIGPSVITHGPALIITNLETRSRKELSVGQIFSEYGYLVQGDPATYEPAPESDPPDETNSDRVQAAGVFNADIGLYVSRPDRAAEYSVQAVYGPYRSNEVRINVIGEYPPRSDVK